MFLEVIIFLQMIEKVQCDYIANSFKEIYNCDFPAEFKEVNGKYIAHINDMALFDDCDKGRDAITHILMSLANNYSNLLFDCELCQLFEVNELKSSPGRLTKYSYADNHLVIKTIEGDHDKIWTCVDCAPDVCTQEALGKEKTILTFYDYDPNKKYSCPVCGCDMQVKDEWAEFGNYIMPYYKEYVLSLVDGHWVLPEGFKIYNDFGELHEDFEWKLLHTSKS